MRLLELEVVVERELGVEVRIEDLTGVLVYIPLVLAEAGKVGKKVEVGIRILRLVVLGEGRRGEEDQVEV